MDAFFSAHADKITGVLSLFDRILIKGHLPLGYPQGREQLLQRQGKLFKDLKGFVLQQSERIKEHARRLAQENARPYEYHVGPIAKEKRAREIAERDGIQEGLVCVIATVEPCRSFRLAFGEGRPRILPARRKVGREPPDEGFDQEERAASRRSAGLRGGQGPYVISSSFARVTPPGAPAS